jgi:starch synthase
VTTVSPTYAQEIQTATFGHGFDGLLRYRSAVLRGILNGVDAEVWNPATDPVLPRPYTIEDAEVGKSAAKTALRRRCGLADFTGAPLFGVVSRLTPQKGLDLLLAALPELVAAGAQLAILGSGDGDLEVGFAEIAAAHPNQIGVHLGYDEALAHLIFAGVDSFICPSRFEPCGLTQLYSMRYGTLPVVRRTGGLADTVIGANTATIAAGSATGFVFDEASAPALTSTLRTAIGLYADGQQSWRQMIRQAMRQNFTWAASAQGYIAVYRQLCSVLAPERTPTLPSAD